MIMIAVVTTLMMVVMTVAVTMPDFRAEAMAAGKVAMTEVMMHIAMIVTVGA